MYVYKCSERPGEFGDNTGLWTVGHYEPKSGAWIAESDHPSTDEASARVAMLNGTSRTQQLVTLDTRLNVLIGQFNALEGRVGTIDQHVTRSLALLGRMLQREASRAGLSPESTASKEVSQVLEQLALLAFTAAKSGEWRMLLAVGLLASVAGVRWATKKFKAELEEKEWYREWVLPLLPVLLGVFAATGTDVLAVKPFGASLWRGLNIGLMAGGAYKAFLKPAQGLFSKVFGSKVKTATLSQARSSARQPISGRLRR